MKMFTFSMIEKKIVGVMNAQRMQLINERKKSLRTNFSLRRQVGKVFLKYKYLDCEREHGQLLEEIRKGSAFVAERTEFMVAVWVSEVGDERNLRGH